MIDQFEVDIQRCSLPSFITMKNDRIDAADAARQTRTAAALCERLRSQPGVVLADEVGMGKTFVAFATAVAFLEATSRRQPVVVMVPPAVAEKWPNDWSVFKEKCLPPGTDIRATPATVDRGTDFFRLLDDPDDRRHHVIFLKHGAMRAPAWRKSRKSTQETFLLLAFVRQAFLYQRDLKACQERFSKWSTRILKNDRFTADVTQRLLKEPEHRWATIWRRETGEVLTDEPVPEVVVDAMRAIDLSDFRNALSSMPKNKTDALDRKLESLRVRLGKSINAVWDNLLRNVELRLPLLVLDEAHHAKNSNQLAQLFDEAGPLSGAFARMLFLTATPFQLGHSELLSVLSRFDGTHAPEAMREHMQTAHKSLKEELDRAQATNLRLERVWGQLRPTDVSEVQSWWTAPPADATERLKVALQAASEARDSAATVERLLKPWVVRHTKQTDRMYEAGARVLDSSARQGGLAVSGDALLPFLLSARAQSLVALAGLQRHKATRAFFADGLASSFEAFLETRDRKAALLDDRDEQAGDVPADARWYLERINGALPSGDASAWSKHPKVAATTEVAIDLWLRGEKVLIFCFYVATGKALRAHISRSLRSKVVDLGAKKLGWDSADENRVMAELERRGENLLRPDSRARRFVDESVAAIAAQSALDAAAVEHVQSACRRFLRTTSFLARFVDLDEEDPVESLRETFATDGALVGRVQRFVGHVKRMTVTERDTLWDALRLRTGAIGTDVSDFDEGELRDRRESLMPNVRLANGQVKPETKRRLMYAFNTPFFPEILVASSVMGEGVDLHLDCRHVIHHDLSWNPSDLEQRTGRLDRIGGKAHDSGDAVMVYEPYLSGAQDEKIYKVVKDRERWFKAMMGAPLDTSEWATDKIAERVPLPDEIAEALRIDLTVT